MIRTFIGTILVFLINIFHFNSSFSNTSSLFKRLLQNLIRKETVQLSKEKVISSQANLDKELEFFKDDFTPSSQAQIFRVSQHKTPRYPTFLKELIIDPYYVSEGQNQIFSVWAKDPEGIVTVKAIIELKQAKKEIEFKLVKGTIYEGKWQGFWKASRIVPKKIYPVRLLAKNKKGEETHLTIIFKGK